MTASRVLAAFAVLTAAAAWGAAAQTGPITAAELEGRWNLTFRGNPAGSKGPQITFSDASGRKTRDLPLELTVRTGGDRIAGCSFTVRGAPGAAEAMPCRLDKGAFVVDLSGTGSGRKGVLTMRLSRTGPGSYGGPATGRAAGIPISFRMGSATMSRPS